MGFRIENSKKLVGIKGICYQNNIPIPKYQTKGTQPVAYIAKKISDEIGEDGTS